VWDLDSRETNMDPINYATAIRHSLHTDADTNCQFRNIAIAFGVMDLPNLTFERVI
jgi:hypothetical protein